MAGGIPDIISREIHDVILEKISEELLKKFQVVAFQIPDGVLKEFFKNILSDVIQETLKESLEELLLELISNGIRRIREFLKYLTKLSPGEIALNI